MTRRHGIRFLALALVIAAVSAAGGLSLAAVTPSRNAADLGGAIGPGGVTGASFVTQPPSGDPSAASDTPLAGFPLSGPSYAILSTGDAKAAPSASQAANVSGDDGGGNVRGDTDFDVTILQLEIQVPNDANCLSIDFKFFSEEFPEFVGQQFNDAFIAELDESTWTTSGSNIVAASNFAKDPSGKEISVNATGGASVAPKNAQGTVYDAATPLLRASKATVPGTHALFLSVLDQGDSDVDSAVFIDQLRLTNEKPGDCTSGARPADGPPPPQVGRTANIEPVRGAVRVNTPGPGGFVALKTLESIPIGSEVDTKRGVAKLTTAADSKGTQRSSNFSQGRFVLAQRRTGDTTAELKLSGGSFKGCPASGSSGKASAARSRRSSVRKLFGNGRAGFRTRGRNSAATVRGTAWTTDDRCDGTLTRVQRGVVSVRDLVLRRTVRVRARQSYLALTRAERRAKGGR